MYKKSTSKPLMPFMRHPGTGELVALTPLPETIYLAVCPECGAVLRPDFDAGAVVCPKCEEFSK